MAKKLTIKAAETCKRVRMAYLYERNEFAPLVDAHPHNIYTYESGRRTPKLHTIRKYIEIAAKKKIKLGLEDFQD